LVDMQNSPTTSRTPAPAPVPAPMPMPMPRPRLTTKAVPIPASRPETHELRELLETHLLAMQALLDEQQRTVARALGATDESRADLRTELRALADVRSPWVQGMAETRALLFVALRELIVGDNDAGVSLQLPAQPKAEPAGPPPS
jgi:hypothetical protein